ncbi:hypothetical protein Pelo_5495 [Pelomyxa schiedti]|nr:hypothetical protein Pelo_5495 [Pelomyxa schiedti]
MDNDCCVVVIVLFSFEPTKDTGGFATCRLLRVIFTAPVLHTTAPFCISNSDTGGGPADNLSPGDNGCHLLMECNVRLYPPFTHFTLEPTPLALLLHTYTPAHWAPTLHSAAFPNLHSLHTDWETEAETVPELFLRDLGFGVDGVAYCGWTWPPYCFLTPTTSASTHTPSMLALTGTLVVCSALPLPTPHTHT